MSQSIHLPAEAAKTTRRSARHGRRTPISPDRPIAVTAMWMALGLLALTVFAYAPAFQNGYIWDDDDYITNNENLGSLQGLWRIWTDTAATPQYYPLVHTTYWIEHALWGLDPTGYHVTNVLLHLTSALLLWRVLHLLKIPGAYVAALIFAVHPVHVESVAWITERKNVLSTVFYLSAALAYVRLKDLPESQSSTASEPRPFHPGLYLLCLGLFLCALLSKTITCSLPAALLLVLWWKRGRIGGRDLLQLLPMFALGIALGLLTVWLEKNQVGARGTDWDFSPADRLLIAGRAVWFYAQKLLVPWPLVFIYPRWQIDPSVWWQWLYPTGAVGLVTALWGLRKRVGKGPLVAVLFFGGTLVPALGFFDVFPMRYSFVADHFQYLASIGLITLFSAAAVVAGRQAAPRFRNAMTCAGAVLIVVFAALTWNQTRAYENLDKLWLDTIQKNPEAWMAYNNLGNLRYHAGRTDEAIAYFRKALALKPDLMEAHNNISLALQDKGLWIEAEDHARKAVELDPQYVQAHNSLGLALSGQGRYEQAIAHFREALRLYPEYTKAQINIGFALQQQGAVLEAIEHYQQVLAQYPDLAVVHNNLGLLQQQQGRLDKAVEHLRRAVQLEPGFARAQTNLERAIRFESAVREQIPVLLRELEIVSQNAENHYQLGLAHSALGDLDRAMHHLGRTLELDPEHAGAKSALEKVRRWQSQSP